MTDVVRNPALVAAMTRMVDRCKAASGQPAGEEGHSADLSEADVALVLSGMPCPPDELMDVIELRVGTILGRADDGDALPELIAGALVEALLVGYFMGEAG